MKKIYPLIAAVLIAMPSASQAQSAQTVQRAAAKVKHLLMPNVAKAAAKATTEGGVWRPGKAVVYEYNNSAWSKQYDQTFTYNTAGYILTDEKSYDNGSATLTTNTYDSLLPSYLTLTTESSRSSATEAWSEPTVTLRREVTHDSEGRITSVTEYADEDSDSPTTLTVKYDNDGKACELSMSQYDSDAGNSTITMSNIKWQDYNYDGLFSFFSSDSEDFGLTGDEAGKITSADLSVSTYGMSLSGTLTGTYTDEGYNQTFSLTYYGMSIMSVKYDMAYTDANGSCVATSVIKTQGSGTTCERQTITMDDHGYCTALLIESGYSTDNLSTREGYTYDYTYDNGRIAEVVTNEWAADGEPYTPMIKTVYSAYADVAASIGTATFQHNDAATAVYTLDGCRVGTTTKNLTKGIYIVRQGTSAKKVTVK